MTPKLKIQNRKSNHEDQNLHQFSGSATAKVLRSCSGAFHYVVFVLNLEYHQIRSVSSLSKLRFLPSVAEFMNTGPHASVNIRVLRSLPYTLEEVDGKR